MKMIIVLQKDMIMQVWHQKNVLIQKKIALKEDIKYLTKYVIINALKILKLKIIIIFVYALIIILIIVIF